MRQALNVSLPPVLMKEVKMAVKRGRYSSASEFIRDVLKMWLSEELLFQDVQEAMKEVKAGKTVRLNSIRDIM